MPSYFPYYTSVKDSDVNQELEEAGTAPIDHGQDVLPFDFLGGRRFEILAYRLRTLTAAGDGKTVTLVQAAADRGRDVLVYDNARLVEIIQCKNQLQKVTRPQLVHELLKLALHAVKDPAVLGAGPVRYEIWGTGDFTEPAALLLDTWSAEWKEELVGPVFTEVVNTYAELKGAKWEDVRKYVLIDFAQIIRPFKQTGLDVTAAVRKATTVYKQFFRGIVVMEAKEVDRTLREILAEGGLRQVTADDMRHVLDRMEQFPSESRIYLGYGYSFGVTPEQLVLLNREELQQFAMNCIRAGVQNLQLLMHAIVRQIQPRMIKKVSGMQLGNGNFRYILSQVLNLRVISRFTKSLIPLQLMKEQPSFDVSGITLDQLIDRQIGLVWDEMQTIVSSHEQRKVKGPNEKLRTKIAEFALFGFASKEALEDSLRADFARNKGAVADLDAEIQALIPLDLMVVADTKMAFGDDRLMKRMVESLNRLDQAHKSATPAQPNGLAKQEESEATFAGPPRLDKVTWSKVAYRGKALFRGYHAALIFTGFNFSPKCTWTSRAVGETCPPQGRNDYWWRDLSFYRPNHLEVSTNDDEFETPLGDINREFCIKNPNGELSEWRKFEYPFDFVKLNSILDDSEKRGRQLYAAGIFDEAVEPLRKAWSMSRHLLKADDARAVEIAKLWNLAIDERSLARLRFRAGQQVRLKSGPFAGRVGTIERLNLRAFQAYQVKFDDGQSCFASDAEVDAAL